MSPDTAIRRFLRSSPYWPVVSHPLLRRILPGLAVSALGDGMSFVAVSWLALQLAPDGHGSTWVAMAVAAYTLPSALGALVFGRMMGGRNGAQLAGWNATLRGGALAAIPVAYALGILSGALYVTLLAISALFASWGSAGRYTLMAQLLPAQYHIPGNAVFTTIGEFATIVGPPLAGVLISWNGPILVIALDAISFGVLAATYRFAVPQVDNPDVIPPREARATGFGVILHNRTLLGLLGLTFGFFFLFGPVYVAMPVYIAEDLHAPATLLGLYYTAFGVGAVAGGLATGYLRRWPLLPTVVGIVLCFGGAMLPLGLGAPIGISLVFFGIAGMIWAPFMSISLALFQKNTRNADLSRVLAFNGAVTVVAVPLGTILGGPTVAAIGARGTLLISAISTLTLGALAAGFWAARRRRTSAADHAMPPMQS
jgi:predicted MFS family arabinose efflux permease